MLGIAFVLLQYMISAKAGLVNYVDGQTNVHPHEQVAEGSPIETQAHGHVELLLTPGVFLRIGNNSKVVLDSVELSHAVVRVIDGSALIEVTQIEKGTPIKVVTGGLETMVVSRGAYRFSAGTASVIDGKLQIVGTQMTVRKGHQVTSAGGSYIASTFVNTTDDLDLWSQSRSASLANANAMAYRDRPLRSTWIYSPFLGGFTFMPRGGYRSYYGYGFYGYGFVPVPAPVLPFRTFPPSRPPVRPMPRPGGVHRPGFHGGGRGGHR